MQYNNLFDNLNHSSVTNMQKNNDNKYNRKGTKTFSHHCLCECVCVYNNNNNNNNNLLHLYSAFLGTQSALHRSGESPQPPPMCSIHLDGSHIAPESPPHTSLLVERRPSDEANIYILVYGDY